MYCLGGICYGLTLSSQGRECIFVVQQQQQQQHALHPGWGPLHAAAGAHLIRLNAVIICQILPCNAATRGSFVPILCHGLALFKPLALHCCALRPSTRERVSWEVVLTC